MSQQKKGLGVWILIALVIFYMGFLILVPIFSLVKGAFEVGSCSLDPCAARISRKIFAKWIDRYTFCHLSRCGGLYAAAVVWAKWLPEPHS